MTSSWEHPSPFIFDGPVPPNLLIGRDTETEILRSWARAGRSVLLVGPRRFGKTSLLRRVRADAETYDRMPVVIVDLYELASMTDLVMRLERAWAEHMPHRLRRAVGNAFTGAQVGLNIYGTGFTMKLADRPNTDPLPALHTLLGLPKKIHSGGRVVMVFDEFQSIAAIPGAEALIRTYVQDQQGEAAYIFAGSQPSMLAHIFEDRDRPFYGQAQRFPLQRIPVEVLAEAVLDQFENTSRDATGALGQVIEFSEGHPQRAMLLAHLLWHRVTPDNPATEDTARLVIADAVNRVSSEIVAVFDGLTTVEAKVVRAVAEFGTPLSARAGRALDLPKSAAQVAAAAMQERTLIEKIDEPERGSWRLVDPLMTRWLRNRYPLRPEP